MLKEKKTATENSIYNKNILQNLRQIKDFLRKDERIQQQHTYITNVKASPLGRRNMIGQKLGFTQRTKDPWKLLK